MNITRSLITVCITIIFTVLLVPTLYASDRNAIPKRNKLSSLEIKKNKLNELWYLIIKHNPAHYQVIVHLVRRAYETKYPIPIEINQLLKDERFNPEDPVVLLASRDLFELVEPENLFSSDIRKK